MSATNVGPVDAYDEASERIQYGLEDGYLEVVSGVRDRHGSVVWAIVADVDLLPPVLIAQLMTFLTGVLQDHAEVAVEVLGEHIAAADEGREPRIPPRPE